MPQGVHGFDEPLTGADGFAMPATQHDLLVWVAAGTRNVVFDEAMRAVRTLGDLATVADVTDGWT